jgi:hypothetical protein
VAFGGTTQVRVGQLLGEKAPRCHVPIGLLVISAFGLAKNDVAIPRVSEASPRGSQEERCLHRRRLPRWTKAPAGCRDSTNRSVKMSHA